MRMKNRLCRMGKTLLGTACLLSTCGIAYSCSDDYDLPDTKPDFLGASIYDELNNRGKFTTVIHLIDDLDLKDVLSKTGSKTLFVADDDAYKKFFETTTWTDGNGAPVRSYSQLSSAQKKILLNSCLLDNAYLLEMMPNLGGTSDIEKNACLRQGTAAAITDSVRWWLPSELPRSYSKTETDYWALYNQPGAALRDRMLMATDNTAPMMTHFMLGQMNMQGITTQDISFILNHDDSWQSGERRNYIYGVRVRSGKDENNRYQSDVTCLNGYFNVLDSVMITPPNMAEMIRTNSNTSIFSHMLDRFSAPFANSGLKLSYASVYGDDNTPDSVFVKRYFSNRSQGNVALSTAPDGTVVNADEGLLSYDPGWNQYASISDAAEKDMAAMFVPNDEALTKYFIDGGGKMLVDQYNPNEATTTENLIEHIDQIPKNILQPLINNLMKSSFNESVPSKYLSIMNDARDPMFSGMTEDEYKSRIEKCLLANNGVVYVMNNVTAPATYSAVSGPALINDRTQIVNSVVTADDNYIQGSDYNNAPLKQYFSTYLRAMQSHFTFFVPTDEALGSTGYVDPAIYGWSTSRRYWRFQYDPPKTTTTSTALLPITMYAYRFDPTTGQTDDDRQASGNLKSLSTETLSSGYGPSKRNMLIELMNQHIIVHDDSEAEKGVQGDANYYIARSGAPVHVVQKGGALGANMVVEGGFQMMLNSSSDYTGEPQQCNVVEGFDQTENTNGYGNGMTYFIDRAMQPTMNSVYVNLNNNPDYSEFLNLLNGYDADLIDDAGFCDSLTSNSDKNIERQKYQFFESDTQRGYNIRFFNNYRYTVYIPTNKAIRYAIDTQGLPTWNSIRTYVDENCNPDMEDKELLANNKKIAQAMITCLVNFLKYHFQDGSVFVDNVNKTTAESETSCVDNERNVYLKIKNIVQTPNALSLTDEGGVSHHVNASVANLLARDKSFDANGASAKYITSSSFAVLHQLDDSRVDDENSEDKGVLYFKTLKKKSFDEWSTPAEAARYVKKYRIRK